MRFAKYHAAGNDFILVNELEEGKVDDKPDFSRKYCNRHKGIGADGAIFLQSSDSADLKFRLFQPDGSEADMSGNGMRCLVRFALDEGIIEKSEFSVETGSGLKNISVNGDRISVNMGEPIFDPEKIPCTRKLINESLEGYRVTACNTGVPHVVVFCEDIKAVDIEKEAPKIRHSDVFPEGANVNFAERDSDGFTIKTFERGVESETLSCGTGSVAVAAAARKLGKINDKTSISSEGGEMNILFEDGDAFLQGYSEKVFEGKID